ncbi:MAG: proteasome assembly chaperone family protein [Candidatus Micrarchaeota archaeon]|nr:MAG: proteasome assembly chaperone family protein [Candidatus Micrarchaeota archaeon]
MHEFDVTVVNSYDGKADTLLVGLPGIGNVGLLFAKNLLRSTERKLLYRIHSKYISQYAIMLRNGLLRLPNNRIYSIKLKSKELLVLTGDLQVLTGQGQYVYNRKLFNFITDELGVENIITIGGYAHTDLLAYNEKSRSHSVYGNASNKYMLNTFKKLGVKFGDALTNITGSVGMLVSLARINDTNGIALLGETGLNNPADPIAAIDVSKIVSKYLKYDIKMDFLEDLHKKILSVINKANTKINSTPTDYIDLSHYSKPDYIR